MLAQKGEFMLLHPHDFAEDGRADNFKALNQVYEYAYPLRENPLRSAEQ